MKMPTKLQLAETIADLVDHYDIPVDKAIELNVMLIPYRKKILKNRDQNELDRLRRDMQDAANVIANNAQEGNVILR